MPLPAPDFKVFQHLTTEKSPVYRPVMTAFMALLHAFDLDFVMTSESEWCCYATLPGVAIYQLAVRAGVDAVHATRWVWNGRERAMATPALPPTAAATSIPPRSTIGVGKPFADPKLAFSL